MPVRGNISHNQCKSSTSENGLEGKLIHQNLPIKTTVHQCHRPNNDQKM